jgi:hypothetical protein
MCRVIIIHKSFRKKEGDRIETGLIVRCTTLMTLQRVMAVSTLIISSRGSITRVLRWVTSSIEIRRIMMTKTLEKAGVNTLIRRGCQDRPSQNRIWMIMRMNMIMTLKRRKIIIGEGTRKMIEGGK